MDEKEEDTTIRISKDIVSQLRKFQRDPRQTNQSIIINLMAKARELKELKMVNKK